MGGTWQYFLQSGFNTCRYEEDVSWMATHLQGIMPFVVYNTKDSSATHYTPVHNGNEAAAYLLFIVDYYDCLPAYMAFIHAHRRDMKVAPDFDMVGFASEAWCQNLSCLKTAFLAWQQNHSHIVSKCITLPGQHNVLAACMH